MDSLVAIEESLDKLEEVLGPLLESNLSHTLLQLDPLQKAKLQVLLPYVINDLVFSRYIFFRKIFGLISLSIP